MVHCHTVHLPLGALLISCTMCGAGTHSRTPPWALRWDYRRALLLAELSELAETSDVDLFCLQEQHNHKLRPRLLDTLRRCCCVTPLLLRCCCCCCCLQEVEPNPNPNPNLTLSSPSATCHPNTSGNPHIYAVNYTYVFPWLL